MSLALNTVLFVIGFSWHRYMILTIENSTERNGSDRQVVAT